MQARALVPRIALSNLVASPRLAREAAISRRTGASPRVAPVGSPRFNLRQRPNPLCPAKSTTRAKGARPAAQQGGASKPTSRTARPGPAATTRAAQPAKSPSLSPRLLGQHQRTGNPASPQVSSPSVAESPVSTLCDSPASEAPTLSHISIHSLKRGTTSPPIASAASLGSIETTDRSGGAMFSSPESCATASRRSDGVSVAAHSPETPGRPAATPRGPSDDASEALACFAPPRRLWQSPPRQSDSASESTRSLETPRRSVQSARSPVRSPPPRAMLEGQVDRINSALEDLVQRTRRSLVADSESELSTAASTSRSPTSCGVLVLDAASVQQHFEALQQRMDHLLREQEELRVSQSEVREMLLRS